MTTCTTMYSGYIPFYLPKMYPRRKPRGYHRLSAVKLGLIKRNKEQSIFKGMDRIPLYKERPKRKRFNYFKHNYEASHPRVRIARRTIRYKNVHTLPSKPTCCNTCNRPF